MPPQTYDWRRRFSDKTASYTVTQADSGTVFTNRGDTDAITFTLPAVSASFTGCVYDFYAIADFSLAVACATADEMVVFNSVTATSAKFATASEIIGGRFQAMCDGTKWLVTIMAEETATVTVA